MRALQWAVDFPDRLERAIVVATGAAASAEQIALCWLQSQAIRLDPGFYGGDYYDADVGPSAGMALARGIGHLSYRSEIELEQRFANSPQDGEQPLTGGRYAVESYLEHHGDKMVGRFDANSYLVLSEAMNHYDVGRGHGGAREALSRVRAQVTIAGISSDRLYPLRLQWDLAELLGTEVHVVDSFVGHDGFLIEHEAVGGIIKEASSATDPGLTRPAGPAWRRRARRANELATARADHDAVRLPMGPDGRGRGHLMEQRGVQQPMALLDETADELHEQGPDEHRVDGDRAGAGDGAEREGTKAEDEHRRGNDVHPGRCSRPRSTGRSSGSPHRGRRRRRHNSGAQEADERHRKPADEPPAT